MSGTGPWTADDCRSSPHPVACRAVGAALVGMLLVGMLLVLTSQVIGQQPEPPAERNPEPAEAVRPRDVVLIEFHGMISSISEQYLYRKLDEAQALGADVLIIEIDSPGGEVDATLRIGRRLADIQWARTVAYIPNEALSGAALFALGCDEIVMAPRAVIGDAAPIFMDESFVFRYVDDKYRSNLALKVRDLAADKRRPPALAEAMIDDELVVFESTHRDTGETRFMSQAEIDSSDDPAAWQNPRPVLETRANRFLEVNGERAVELTLAQGIARDRNELRRRYEPIEKWVELETNQVDRAIVILNSPWITGVLFVIGLIALYIEFASPGLGIGGLIALLCFSLFFWSRFLGGTAEWFEVMLFVGGLALILVEIFVIPGFGLWGGTGIMLMLASLVLASQPFFLPRNKQDLQALTQSMAVVLASMVVFIGLAGWLTRRIGQVPIFRQLLLQPQAEAVEGNNGSARLDTTVLAGCVVRVGDRGLSESPLRPAGRIRLGEAYVDVVSDGSYIDAGQLVQVVDVRGNRIVVRQVT
jgi:membrane-bound serine protease (ClpP class)